MVALLVYLFWGLWCCLTSLPVVTELSCCYYGPPAMPLSPALTLFGERLGLSPPLKRATGARDGRRELLSADRRSRPAIARRSCYSDDTDAEVEESLLAGLAAGAL